MREWQYSLMDSLLVGWPGLLFYLVASSWAILLVAQGLVSPGLKAFGHWSLQHPRSVVLNLLIIAAAQLPILALGNRYALAFSLVAILCYLIAAIDRIKYANALTHFLWSDLFKTTDAGKLSELASHYVRPAIFGPIVGLLALGNILIAAFWGRPFTTLTESWLSRLIAFLIGLAGLALTAKLGDLANGRFNRRFKIMPQFSTQDYDQNVRRQGTLAAFAGHIRLVAVEQDRPADYGPETASVVSQRLHAGLAATSVSQYQFARISPEPNPLQFRGPDPIVKPNIIVLAVEALWDITRFPGLSYAEDPFMAFRGDVQGDVLASCFAGLTANSEFEFLTSLSMQCLHDSACPFIHLKQPVPALPQQLRQMGYLTTAMHSYTRTFYDRDRIYPSLGFDQFLGLEEFEQAGLRSDKGWYMADEALIEPIRRQLAASAQPQFIYVLTMQNHGPYASRRYTPAELEPAATPEFAATFKGNAGDRQAIINYTQGVRDSGKLYQAVKALCLASGQPTLILAFGDHLPGIGAHAGYPLFLDNQLAASVRDPALYKVPWSLWTSPGLSRQSFSPLPSDPYGQRQPIHFNGLAPRLLQAAGLPLSATQQLALVLENAPARPADPEIKRSAGSADLWSDYAWLHYDWLWGEQYLLRE